MEELKEMNSSVDGLQDTIYTEVKDPYGFIYITTNLIDGKRYLGQRKFYGNWQEYLGSGAAFKQAIDKYGIIKGNILAIYRIIRCNPFSHGGVDKLK